MNAINILRVSSIGSLSNISAYKAKKIKKDPFSKERERIRLRKKMASYLEDQIKYNTLIWCHSGLTSDTDFIWVRVVLDMRLKYPNKIKLQLHIPHEAYMKDGVTRGIQTMLWVDYIEDANRVTTYTDNMDMTVRLVKDGIAKSKATTPSEKVIETINKTLIDKASVILAIYDHTPTSKRVSSLRAALDYATVEKKKIRQIKPRTL